MQLQVPETLFNDEFKPHAHQVAAVEMAAANRVMVVTGGPGCIAADTELLIETEARRGHGGRRYTIEDAYHKFHRIPRSKRGDHRFWPGDVFTLSLLPDGGVNYNRIIDIVSSGVKEVFEVRSAAGRVLRVTQEHPFRVPTGGDHEGFARLIDLDVGALVVCRRAALSPLSPERRTSVHRREHHVPAHPGARRKNVTVPTSRTDPSKTKDYQYHLVRESRLAVEADRNNMSFDAFLQQLQESSEGLTFLAATEEVHHINGDPSDNRLSNLKVLNTSEHAREHGWNNRRHFGNQTTETDTIVSIKSLGRQPTFDLVMKAPAHNYVAGGYVVHNTGKTTVIRYIIEMLQANGVQVVGAAPTGKAAQRFTEQTGVKATTIHRLLGWAADGGWTFDAEEPVQFDASGKQISGPLPCGALIIDETSMVDVELMAAVMQALTPDQRLILVGDVDQLPSIGPGSVLRDIIESGTVPVTRLTKIFRQADQSQIIHLAPAIKEGDVGDLSSFKSKATQVDVAFVEQGGVDDVANLIVKAVTQLLPERKGFAPDDIQVLCPQHGRAMGDEALNARLQQALNPNYSDEPKDGLRIGRQARAFEGDRVMCVRNNYQLDVANGEQGKVLCADWRGVDPNFLLSHQVKHAVSRVLLVVDFGGGRVLGFGRGDVDDVELAYAITVHKSQGAQFPCVVMPVHSDNQFMLTRKLFYTAVTRASAFLLMIGEESAVQAAAANTRGNTRNTDLEQLLQEGTT